MIAVLEISALDVEQHEILAGAREGLRHRPAQVAGGAGEHDGTHQNSGGSAGKLGLRFSRCEATPSFASGPVKPSTSSASEASNAGPAIRSQLLSEYLVQRSAVCAPAASSRATSSAFVCSSDSSQVRDTRPIRSASSPLMVLQVSR